MPFSAARAISWIGPLPLDRAVLSSLPASVGGVYVLQGRSLDPRGYPVAYVGSTTDLRRRLTDHLVGRKKFSIWALHKLGATYFSLCPVRNTDARLGIEAGLILRLRPTLNTQVPRVVPLISTLPPINVSSQEID